MNTEDDEIYEIPIETQSAEIMIRNSVRKRQEKQRIKSKLLEGFQETADPKSSDNHHD